jgi:hypothetical protein
MGSYGQRSSVSRSRRRTRRVDRREVLIMLRWSVLATCVLALALATEASAASPASPLSFCIPKKAGRAVTTPVNGRCPAGASLKAASASAAQLDATRAALQDARAQIAGLKHLLAGISRGTVNGRPTLTISGLNVRVVDGTGSTDGAPNGLGNLIVGYDEQAGAQTGSHNIILGLGQRATSWGSVVGGTHNASNGPSQILFGTGNDATGPFAGVLGGTRNSAATRLSAILGGCLNQTGSAPATLPDSDECLVGNGQPVGLTDQGQTIGGGAFNSAAGTFTAIAGGELNHTDNEYATVAGGFSNVARAGGSSVLGGSSNTATSFFDAVVGGLRNSAAGGSSVVVGGVGNSVGPGAFASALLGGSGNILSASTVTLPATP